MYLLELMCCTDTAFAYLSLIVSHDIHPLSFILEETVISCRAQLGTLKNPYSLEYHSDRDFVPVPGFLVDIWGGVKNVNAVLPLERIFHTRSADLVQRPQDL